MKSLIIELPVHHPHHGDPVHSHENHQHRQTTNNQNDNPDRIGSGRSHHEKKQENHSGDKLIKKLFLEK